VVHYNRKDNIIDGNNDNQTNKKRNYNFKATSTDIFQTTNLKKKEMTTATAALE